MLQLYYGSGSRELQLINEKNRTVWNLLKRNIVRYLELDGSVDSAAFLNEHPFELWAGTNSFNDDFELLYLKVDIEEYLRLEHEVKTNQFRFWKIAKAFEATNNPIRFIAVDASIDETAAVSTPTLATSSATVERALRDSETLIKTNGATSGIDRVHTALHGYLIEICKEESIAHASDANITTLFGLVRQKHPKLQTNSANSEPHKILRGLASIIDELNLLRNRNSMAHPSNDLLEEPEAILAINSVRSLLHYLNMKLQ